jgi:hypothetical protein
MDGQELVEIISTDVGVRRLKAVTKRHLCVISLRREMALCLQTILVCPRTCETIMASCRGLALAEFSVWFTALARKARTIPQENIL